MKRHPQNENHRRHGAGSRIPRALLELAQPSRLTFTLRDRHLLEGELPIREILDAATEVITQGRCRADRRLTGWLFRISLRAVCEAVVECGYLPLPLAVGLETCWRKDAAPASPKLRLPRHGEVIAQRPTEPMRLVIRVDEPAACDGEMPLSEVLDAALDVLANGRHRPGDWRGARWFFRQVLRAVCEAILEAGTLPLPLSVSVHHRERGWHVPVRPKGQVLTPFPVPLWPPSDA